MARNCQSGFTITAAIFILVTLAALGAFILTVSTTQHIGAALDVQGAQAYQSAQSGVEWGVYKALKDAAPPCSAGSGANTDIGVVSGMQVTVNCTQIASGSSVEAGLGTIYSIVATACNVPSAGSPKCPGDISHANYVERRITAMVEK